MIKHYLKVVLMITGITLYLFQTSTIIQAKVLLPFEGNFNNSMLFAAPPPPAPGNDDCINAITLTINPTCSFTAGTVDLSTESAPAATCNGFTSPNSFDVWYKFTAGLSGQKIILKGSASFDAVVLLMDGCNGNIIDCSDNSLVGGTEMLNTIGLTAGNIYYIRIYAYGNGLPLTSTFDICVSLPTPPPANDNCVNAISLNVDSTCISTSGSLTGSTQSGPADSCNSVASLSAYDVWYKFIATAANNVIRVQGALSFDAVVILKDNCNGNVINCADRTYSGGIETINDSSLIIGHTYYIRVYHYGNSIPSTPDFDICVSLPVPPPLFDNCANAILLNVDSTCNYTLGTVEGSTQSGPADICDNNVSSTAYDVWYKFVAGVSGQTITVKGSAYFDPVISLRNSCGGVSIDCSNNTGSGGTESLNTSGLIAGNTYYIRVYSNGSDLPLTPDFEICVALPPPIPVNDTCTSATLLTVSSVCNFMPGTVAGSTESGPADSCGNYTSSSAYDVWYKFVATATNNAVTVQGSVSFDAVVILKDGCNGSTIGCSDNTYSEGIETIYSTGLIIGNTYYVRVYAYGAGLPSSLDFNICVTSPPPPPANDDCANAITLTANATCTTISGTVAGSTQSLPADTCGGYHSIFAYDVWYKFIAVATGQTITVKGSQSFDAVIVLMDSCNSNPIDCVDTTTSGGTEVINSSGLIIGNTYYIRVYAFGSTQPSTPSFDICLLDSGPMSITTIENKDNLVSVYPNPASNKVTIGLKTSHNSDAVWYKIINVNGQSVAEGRFASNNLQKDVDLSYLTSGVYNIQITISNTIINKKIVVMNK